MKGTVKFFNDEKGWGFIKPETGGADIFVHHTNISMTGRRTLVEGEEVNFDCEDSGRGAKAVNVVRIVTNNEGNS